MKTEQLQNLKNLVFSEQSTILNFFKSRFPLFHNSNIFFRDMQFTINAFFELKSIFIGYSLCEQITKDFFAHLEKQNMAVPVSTNAWKINNELYKTGAPLLEETAVATV